MPRCRDCAEQDGFDGMCLAKGEYKTPNTPACELFFASNAAEIKGLRVLNRELRAENAKLRKEIAKWERLAAGIDLPEYPVTQFKPKDLERENAKLRELVDYMTPIAWYEASERERDRMREMGIEVPE